MSLKGAAHFTCIQKTIYVRNESSKQEKKNSTHSNIWINFFSFIFMCVIISKKLLCHCFNHTEAQKYNEGKLCTLQICVKYFRAWRRKKILHSY